LIWITSRRAAAVPIGVISTAEMGRYVLFGAMTSASADKFKGFAARRGDRHA